MEEVGRVGPHIAQNAAPAPDQEEVPDPLNPTAQKPSMVLWDVGMNGWAGPPFPISSPGSRDPGPPREEEAS
jgi:hypothetical protein